MKLGYVKKEWQKKDVDNKKQLFLLVKDLSQKRVKKDPQFRVLDLIRKICLKLILEALK